LKEDMARRVVFGSFHRQKCARKCSKTIPVNNIFIIKKDLSAGSIASSEIAALSHEVRNDSVEARALVSKASLASAKLTEVFRTFWGDIIEKLQKFMIVKLY